MTSPSSESGPRVSDGTDAIGADEAFALLGNDTRVGILRALWEAFESGTADNAVPFSDLYDRVDIRDTGNFSYHLEKLTGPFVRDAEDGYELKQTGINVLRAVESGTVTEDPSFGPTDVDVACPLCDATVEVAYADELLTVTCSSCPGVRQWRGESGFLVGGLVPPSGIANRPIEEAFRAGVSHVTGQVAALHRGTCPHCAGPPAIDVDVCLDHDDGGDEPCSSCGWRHRAEVWLVCETCKRSVFPPVAVVVLDDPRVTAFYGEHGIDYRYESWETIVRYTEVEEELVSTDPLELRYTIPAGKDELELTVDEALDVLEVS